MVIKTYHKRIKKESKKANMTIPAMEGVQPKKKRKAKIRISPRNPKNTYTETTKKKQPKKSKKRNGEHQM